MGVECFLFYFICYYYFLKFRNYLCSGENPTYDLCFTGYLQRPPPRESAIDLEKLNSARRRLQENYQEAQNGVILDFGIYKCKSSNSSSTILVSPFGFYSIWLLLYCFCFVKLKSKGQYRWWIFMRFQNQRTASLPRIKAAFRAGITADFCQEKAPVCVQ